MKIASVVFYSVVSRDRKEYNYRYDDSRFQLKAGDMAVVRVDYQFKVVEVVNGDVQDYNVKFEGKLKLLVDKVDMESWADAVLAEDNRDKLEAEVRRERVALEKLVKDRMDLNFLQSVVQQDPELKSRFDSLNAKLEQLK